MRPEIMRWFAYGHLPEAVQKISEPFATLAEAILELPDTAERSACLRKLLEAKDCAVRAFLTVT